MGVWIEILLYRHVHVNVLVAPFVGVWIEINVTTATIMLHNGRSLRGSVD